MLDGEFGRHVRRVQKIYARRRDALLGHLNGELSPWLEPIVPVAGIHLATRLRPGLAEQDVIGLARKASIGLYGISGFYAGRRARQGLLWGYGDVTVDGIHASMDTLTALLAKRAP
jgi:GntR family transcriptional regulator/MocR family aminotransferase